MRGVGARSGCGNEACVVIPVAVTSPLSPVVTALKLVAVTRRALSVVGFAPKAVILPTTVDHLRRKLEPLLAPLGYRELRRRLCGSEPPEDAELSVPHRDLACVKLERRATLCFIEITTNRRSRLRYLVLAGERENAAGRYARLLRPILGPKLRA